MNDLINAELAEVLSKHNISDLSQNDLMTILEDAKEIQFQRARSFELEELSKEKFEIEFQDIKVELGVPWISEDFINEFASHICGHKLPKDTVIFEKNTGVWEVFKSYYGSQKFGTYNYPTLRLLEATLNGRKIQVTTGNGLLLESETIEALEKQKQMKLEFENWIWKDDYRRLKITKAYNDMFGRYSKTESLDVIPTYEGLNDKIELYDYQKTAIKKILSRKNSLVATEVGTGKTYIMIVAAMEMLNKGISRKNMFVVPNNIVGQWKSIFNMLYPESKVLVIEPKNFKKDNKDKTLKEARDGSYDAIIIAYSCFDRVNINADYIVKEIKKEINVLTNEEEKSSDYRRINLINKKIEKLKKKICSVEKETSEDEESVHFNDLGITGLFVDEAHNYKNLSYEGTIPLVKGLANTYSKKSENLLAKVRFIQGKNGRVIFATGTPLANSLTDTFTMQTYLQYDELCDANLNNFKNWLKTFARIERIIEIDPTGNNFCETNRIYQFVNLPELSKMFSRIAIFHTNSQDDLPGNINYITQSIDGGLNFKKYMQYIVKRVENIHKAMKMKVMSYLKKDNMLKICTDGRKAALDLKLVGVEQNFDESSKIWHCIRNVLAIYKNDSESSQIIFCDYSTPKNEKYNVYQELKYRLLCEGVKESEIAFIHDYTNEEEKSVLFEKVNNSEIKILIGSTVKLGVGVNVQTRLKAIHHLDIPWRPSDVTQREGRIIRRGNLNDNIAIFRYVVKNSFDAYFWQLLEYKQTFISQFLSGSANQRTMSDLETNVLNYGAVKALALDKPEIKLYAEKVNELKLAKIVLLKSIERSEDIVNEIQSLNTLSVLYDEELVKIKKINDTLKQIDIDEIKKDVESACSLFAEDNYEIGCEGKFFDFEAKVLGFKDGFEKKMQLSFDGLYFYIDLGDKNIGNKIRLLHFFEKFDKEIENKLGQIEKCKTKLIDLDNELHSIDMSEENINKLEEEVKTLQNMIKENI